MINLKYYSPNLKIFSIKSESRNALEHRITINRHKIYCSCESFSKRLCKCEDNKIIIKDYCKHIKELLNKNVYKS